MNIYTSLTVPLTFIPHFCVCGGGGCVYNGVKTAEIDNNGEGGIEIKIDRGKKKDSFSISTLLIHMCDILLAIIAAFFNIYIYIS